MDRAPGDRDVDLRTAIARASETTGARTRAAQPGGGFVRPGESTTGKTPLRPGAARANAGSLEPRTRTTEERDRLAAMLDLLATAPTGVQALAALRAVGSTLAVLTESEFAQAGGGEGEGCRYDSGRGALFVRSSWMARNPAVTASSIAHEATRAVDEATGLLPGAREHRARALARVSAKSDASEATIADLVQQTTWELLVAAAARAFVIQGQVLRELGQAEKGAGPIALAAAGANDEATYARVFTMLVNEGGPAYNPDGRTAEPVAL